MMSLRRGEDIESHEWDVLQSWARGPFHAIDLGANVGLHALPLAARNPDGKVYAFEAHPVIFSYLQFGALVNGFGNCLELINSAVCDQSGVVSFTGHSLYGSTADGIQDTGRGWLEKHTLTVPSVSLDDWMQKRQPERVDFMKLDIEGGELLALSSAVNLLKRFRPKILMEMFPLNLAAYGKTTQHVVDFATQMGYGI
jgi:FkbM family methyltransferase